MARHYHVDVVVPGYEALVTHGAEHRASVHPYGQIMFGAYAQQLLQQVQLDKLQFSQAFHYNIDYPCY